MRRRERLWRLAAVGLTVTALVMTNTSVAVAGDSPRRELVVSARIIFRGTGSPFDKQPDHQPVQGMEPRRHRDA